MKKLKVATVFSGIGAIEKTLENLNIDHEIIFASDNNGIIIDYDQELEMNKIKDMTKWDMKSHIDFLYSKSNKTNFVEKSYLTNYKIKDNMFLQDVCLIDGTKFKNEIDLFVGGSPCQSFSVMGKRAGLKDARGTLFYEYARLVDEIQPNVFIYENVKGLLSHDKGNTWKVMQEVFDDIGYDYYFSVENAKKHGIPQNRDRIFVVGFKKGSHKPFEFKYNRELNLKVSDFLEEEFDEKYILPVKGFEFVTNDKYRNRAKVNQDIMMCQKANQQYNWNGDFIFIPSEDKEIPKKHYGDYNGLKGYIRKLTPKECLKLMGFENFEQVVSDTQMYKQAGNSIVVNVLEDIMKEIMEVAKW